MTIAKKQPDTTENKDIQQDSSLTDSDPKDRPGTRPGQPPATADYDYRPDFGTSGGGADFDQPIDGESVRPKHPQKGAKHTTRRTREGKQRSQPTTK